MDNLEGDGIKVKSHIQIPKLLLKRFQRNGTFAIYDVENKTISKRGTAGNANIQLGYYSTQFEATLNEEIERPFSKTLSILEKWDYENCDLSIKMAPIWNFIYSLFLRDPIVHEQVKNTSLCRLLPGTQQNDFIVAVGLEAINELDLLSKFNTMTVLINKTNTPFVLPMMGIYSYKNDGESMINLPINPKMAICLLCRKETAMSGLERDGIPPITTESPQVIMQLNEFAFEAQVKKGQGFVICPDLGELKRLVNTI